MAEGKPFRFAVGTMLDLRSSVWTVATRKRDVYIAGHHMRGTMKVSLHESGDNRIAMTEESGSIFPETGDRVMKRWRRPEPWGPDLTTDLQIIVPAVSLRVPAYAVPRLSGKEINWTPAPAPGEKVVFFVVIAGSEHQGLSVEGNDSLCGEIEFANGGGVVVFVRRERALPDELRQAQHFVDEVAITGTGSKPDWFGGSLLYFDMDPDSPGVLMDIPLSEEHVTFTGNPPKPG
jgi:hypothetical protein